MVVYLESIISQTIDSVAVSTFKNHQEDRSPSADSSLCDNDWVPSMKLHGNFVASKRNMHSHTGTCYKYKYKKVVAKEKLNENSTNIGETGIVTKKKNVLTCCFNFPKKLHLETGFDENGILHMARNDHMINIWNPLLSSILRSNHDIAFIPSTSKTLATVYYMINYATVTALTPNILVMRSHALSALYINNLLS